MSIKGQGSGGAGGGTNTPDPPNTSIQYNNGGAFGGDANLTWLTADGLTNLKHAAFGADAVIDQSTLDSLSAPIVLVIEETQSLGAAGQCYGEVISLTGSPTVNDTSIFIRGEFVDAFVPPTSNKNFGTVQGAIVQGGSEASSPAKANSIYGQIGGGYIGGTGSVGQMTGGSFTSNHYGTGTADIAVGTYNQVDLSSVGIITDAKGVWIDSANNSGGGTITTNHGLFIEDQTVGVTNFAIKTGLGTVSFGDDVVTTADMKAATYHVGASAGIDASITTATLVGKTITVSKGIITGFA